MPWSAPGCRAQAIEVHLLVILASVALAAGPDLRADTDTVTDLEALDLGADLDGLSDDLRGVSRQ